MLLLTTNACATETTHANTIKPIIIIILLSFLYFLLFITVLSFSRVFLKCVSRRSSCATLRESYFMAFILLFTTTASTTAAQQIAKINPKIIIILILSLNLLS